MSDNFAVGDRVEFMTDDHFYKKWNGCLATVHKVKDGKPYVDADDENFPNVRNSPWGRRHWRLIDQAPTFIPEDWS